LLFLSSTTAATTENIDKAEILNWGDSTDSLRLKAYTPSGALLGTYYDSADGTTDGRIHLYIQNPDGI